MNGDGTLHVVLPSADQRARPRLRASAIVQLCGSGVAAVLAILSQPRLAVVVLSAAMLPYGVSVLLQRTRVLRGLHGGDEGAVPAGTAAALAGGVAAIVLAGAGLVAGSAVVLGGSMMLVTTAQGLLARPLVAAHRAQAALLLASVSFAFGVASLAGAGGWVLLVSLLTACAAAAIGGESLMSNQMGNDRTSGGGRATSARGTMRAVPS